MVNMLLLCSLLVLGNGAQAPPGTEAGLFGNLVGLSDFQLNLHPPEENAQDVEEALDALMKVEKAKLAAENDDFSMAKQRMLNDERIAIADLVQKSFAPLRSKLAGTRQGRSFSFLSTGHAARHAMVQPSIPEKSETAVLDIEAQTAQLGSLREEITSLGQKVAVGGSLARAALARLVGIAAQPNAKAVIDMSGIVQSCKDLMRREETSDELRGLAGSLLTLLSDLPVVSETSTREGSYGHVNIVLPRPSRLYRADAEILELQQGMKASDTRAGSFQ